MTISLNSRSLIALSGVPQPCGSAETITDGDPPPGPPTTDRYHAGFDAIALGAMAALGRTDEALRLAWEIEAGALHSWALRKLAPKLAAVGRLSDALRIARANDNERERCLTFPFAWRRRLAQDGALLGRLTRLFLDTVQDFYAKRAAARGGATAAGAKSGAVTVVQRTSSDLRLNPHLHVVFLDGAYHEHETELVWQPLGHLQTREVGQVLERAVRRIDKHLRRHGLLEALDPNTELEDPEDQLAASAVSGQAPPAGPQWRRGLSPLPAAPLGYDKPLCASLAGFTLHAATRAGAMDTAGRETLLRYVLRPPIAYERIERRPDGLVHIALKRAFADRARCSLPPQPLFQSRSTQKSASFTYAPPSCRRMREMPEYVAVSKVMVCGALLLFACAGPGSYVRNEIGEREALKAAERRAAGAAQLAAIERTIQEEKESLQRAQQEEDTIVQRNGVTGPSVHETFDAIDDMRRDDTMLTAITHELPCAMRIGDATVRLDRLRYGSIEQLEYVSSNLIGTIYTMSVADELGGRAKIKLESPAVAQRLKRAFAHLGELCGAPSRPFDAESLPLREIPRSSWRRTDEYFG